MTETALQKYELKPEQIAKQAAEFMSLEIILDDKESYRTIKDAKQICVKVRTGTEKRRLELNVDYQKRIKENNAAANQLINAAAPAETHLKAELQKEDDRVGAILEKKRQNEIGRVNAIQANIALMKSFGERLHGMGSEALATFLNGVKEVEISLEKYQEYAQVAKTAKEETVAILQAAHAAQLKQEQEDEARKVENERLAKRKAEQEKKDAKQKAAQDKIDKDNLKLKVANDKLESEKKVFAETKVQVVYGGSDSPKPKHIEAPTPDGFGYVKVDKAKAAEKARLSELQPDKDKLCEYINDNLLLPDIKLKTQEANKLFEKLMCDINDIIEQLESDIEDL